MLELLQDGIKLPEQNNLTWVFPIRINGGKIVLWKVDSFDLSLWFKEELGRYPRHERGDKDELQDLIENWGRFEPRLRAEAEKQINLGVSVTVDGMRATPAEWRAAQEIPKEELPPLTDAQREAAKSLGIAEEDYARSFVAGERTWNTLLDITKRLAAVLQLRARSVLPGVQVESVVLRTWNERFDVQLRVGGQAVTFGIEESLVDKLFESGSEEAERNLNRILELALGTQVHS